MTESKQKPIRKLRWWIGGMLFASTVINYIDRQTLSALAPYLKKDLGWTNSDYADLVIAFRISYSFGQTLFGRLHDRIGVRRGLTISVIWYSIASMLTALATGWKSFAGFRFLLGAGESGNWPAATKAVGEWFPKRERGWATALFDSGSSIGGAIVPALVGPIYLYWGWRPAFIIPGFLGFFWLIAWRKLYYPPESHPRISPEEQQEILRDRQEDQAEANASRPSWKQLLRLPQTWGTIIARAFTDPVWFFIADWFAIYLVSRGFDAETALFAFWIPFLAADLGNFFGGGVSSWLIKRGWPVGRARKAVVVFGAAGMTLLIPTISTSSLWAIAALFAVSTFAYASFSTMAIVFAPDLFQNEAVATVSGMSGTAAGIGTIVVTKLIGYVADHYSFAPIMIGASVIPVIGAILVLLLVRNTEESGRGILRRI